MRSILTVVLLGLTMMVSAQSAGTLKGKLVDKETKEPLMMATVQVFQGGVFKKGGSTDFDGNYVIKPIEPGTYEIRFEYLGYNPKLVNDVLISPDQTTTLNGIMSEAITELGEVEIVHYKVPLIDKNSVATTSTAEDIDQLGETNMSNVVSLSSGMYQKDDGASINAKGGRDDANVYFVDGVKMIGSNSLPAGAVDQISVINGGVPARYGDAMGAIVNITTKGVTRNHFFSFDGRSNLGMGEILDPYGMKMTQMTYGGPLLWKKGVVTKPSGEAYKGADGTDSTGKIRPVLGLLLSGSYQYDKDRGPAANGINRLSDSALAVLNETPVSVNPYGQGIIRNAEYLTDDAIVNVPLKDNNSKVNFNLTGKLTFALDEQIDLAIGGRGRYQDENISLRDYTLMNFNNNPAREITEYSVYGRFTHRLSKDKQPDENGVREIDFISNAFYTVQYDYTYFGNELYDENHKFNPFAYGHFGKFDFDEIKVDFSNQDAFQNAMVFNGDTGVVFTSYFENGLNSFTPSNHNPVMGAYAQNWIDNFGGDLMGVDDILSNGGRFVNGFTQPKAHDIYTLSGMPYNNFYKEDERQRRLTLSGNVDLNFRGSGAKSDSVYTHAIQFGMEYEERELSRYSMNSPAEIWKTAGLYLNQHIQPDNDNLVQLGAQFGQYINYYAPHVADLELQTTFDRNLRDQLNAGETEIINIHNLDPNDLSMDLFSADELTNASASPTFAQYYGYDYKGNKLPSSDNTSFNDFFTDKENRPIAAFRPVYTAFYVEDKFEVNDLAIRFGLRVDQFDANTMVMKDKFSLYETYKRGSSDADGANLLGSVTHPGNIGEDYTVYVDDFENPSAIVGYRNGDDWYNAQGVQIPNGKQLALASASGNIQPYLVRPDDNIKSDDYDPTTSFTDYVPQINVMPRLNFAFQLNSEALFYAHYDVLTQRPGSGPFGGANVATPFNYMYMQELATRNFGNPDLKPEKTIDYSVGFQQVITKSSVIKISTFYREMRDMIHLRRINFAYPISYTTYDNTDFATIKGFTFTYDLRRTGNIKLTADYTLQFVEGTGSDAESNENFMNAIANLAEEDPDMKVIHPLTYDQRHTLTTNIDYRFADGSDYKGPMIRKIKTNSGSVEDTTYVPLLANVGLNTTFRVGSGVPYSRQVTATPQAETADSRGTISEGSINGSRMPGSFRVDLKLDKTFAIKFGKKPEDELSVDDRKSFDLNAYIMVKNVLNARNVTQVYSYTGMPDDDGFIASQLGAQKLKVKPDDAQRESYVDLYEAKINNPAHYIMPRRMFIGMKLNF